MLIPVPITFSGRLASGNVGWPHHASGAVRSGHLSVTETPDGTKFLRDDFTWRNVGSVSLMSGSVMSGHIASGAVQGFFGATRHVASGTLGVDDFGSGAIVAGAVGSGAIRSGNIASGSVGFGHIANAAVQSGGIASGIIGTVHLADNSVTSGDIASGSVSQFHLAAPAVFSGQLASGIVGSVHLADNAVQSGDIASGVVFRFSLASGAVNSGHLADASVVSGSIASGAVGFPHLADASVRSGSIASGIIGSVHLADASVTSGDVASGVISRFHHSSGSVTSGHIGDNATVSGSVASGQLFNLHIAAAGLTSGNYASGSIGKPHIASGAIASGQLSVTQTPDGTKFLRDDFSWQNVAGASLMSGSVQSGHVASGVVQGFFGSTRHIASGTVGVNDFGSGAIVAGTIGSGAVQSGNIASGQVGFRHLANASVQSGTIASGIIGTVHLADASVTSGDLASGVVSRFHLSSGAVNSGHVGNNAVVSGGVASGQLDTYHFASGATATRAQFGIPIASGTAWSGIAGEPISGTRAVCVHPSGHLQIAMASVASRMPAIGVVFANVASGIQCDVYTFGLFDAPASGNFDFSGYVAKPIYVGRSGQVVTSSGSFNSGGLKTVDTWQVVGYARNSGSLFLSMDAPIADTMHEICSVFQSGGDLNNGQRIEANTVTQVLFSGETLDPFAMHVNTTAGRITSLRAGTYLSTFSFVWNGIAAARQLANFRLNGTTNFGRQDTTIPATASGAVPAFVISDIVALASGDYVDVIVYHESPIAISLYVDADTNSLFKLYRLGD